MEWISPRAFGIMWNAWSLEVLSLNVRKVPSWSMKLTAFYAFNLNDNHNDNYYLTQIAQITQILGFRKHRKIRKGRKELEQKQEKLLSRV